MPSANLLHLERLPGSHCQGQLKTKEIQSLTMLRLQDWKDPVHVRDVERVPERERDLPKVGSHCQSQDSNSELLAPDPLLATPTASQVLIT